MNNEDIKRFISGKTHLFWHIPDDKKEKISLDLLVEVILNYGTLEDVKIMFNLIGIERVAEIFHTSVHNRKRNNYHPPVLNFFNLYFKRHVQRYII